MPYADPEKRREWARKRWEKIKNDPVLLAKYREKMRGYTRNYMAKEKNRTTNKKATIRWRKEHPNYRQTWALEKKYGMTREQYQTMLNQQSGLCAICGKHEAITDPRIKNARNLAVDHCHKTGAIRGLLCFKCNVAIGLFNHDTAKLEAAIVYLAQTESNNLTTLLCGFPNPPTSESIKLRRISYNLKYRFGITWLAFKFLEREQNAVCKICGQPEPRFLHGKRKVLSIDHCHESGKIRGLLCSRCNPGIGYLNYDKDLLLRAINYLEQ